MATAKKKSLTFKQPGRKPGSANKANGVPRNEKFSPMRCSEGFAEAVKEMTATGMYGSKADVLHEAVQLLSLKRIPGSKWIDKI